MGTIMDRCYKCKNYQLAPTTIDETRTISGKTFSSKLPGIKCLVCGEIVYSLTALRDYELGVALVLANYGPHDAESIRFITAALDLNRKMFASALLLPESEIISWERDGVSISKEAIDKIRKLIEERIREIKTKRGWYKLDTDPFGSCRECGDLVSYGFTCNDGETHVYCSECHDLLNSAKKE